MKRISSLTGVLLAVGALAAFGAGAGTASVGATATIQEVTVFGTNHQPAVGTFTATGLPACASGSFNDKLVWFSPSGARLILDRTYTCAEGGSFSVRVGLHLSVVDASGNQAVDGSWRVTSSDGALTGLQGTGSTTGLNTGCAPVGSVFAPCVASSGTTTASIH